MNTNFFKRTSSVLSLAAVTVVCSGLQAQAQTIAAETTEPSLNTTALTSASALIAEPSAPQIPEATSKTTAPVVAQAQDPVVPSGTTPGRDDTAPSTFPGDTRPGTDGTVPGTVPYDTEPDTTPDVTEPGTDGFAPGRATRSGSSYVGAAGNIGLSGGETALGIGNFTVISKIGLAEAVSVRPAVVIGDNTTFLIPVTYDFNLQPTGAAAEPISTFAPYLGGGLVIATGNDDSDFGGLLSAGVDVPLNPQFTATAGVNVGILDNTSVGLLIGVGYTFQGF